MFERFTATARHTVVLAQEEARGLQHNYIGTEHILLGLLGEPEGVAFRVLESFGVTLDGVRREVTETIGAGKQEMPKGHIPFTPRAKKVLELSLREALALHHNYIGTEHILLGLIREGDGVAAQVLRKHSDLLPIRVAVLDAVPAGAASEGLMRRWARRLTTGDFGAPGSGRPLSGGEGAREVAVETGLTASPAADTTLSEAARLAGSQPVGSHHLLLAALADPDSAAARVLAGMGLDLDHAKEALRTVNVAGTSDEQPEDAGRRQMVIQVTDELLTIVVADPILVMAGAEALTALGEAATPGSAIHGKDLRGSAADSLAKAWQALSDTLAAITRTAAQPAAQPVQPSAGDTEEGKQDSGAGPAS